MTTTINKILKVCLGILSVAVLVIATNSCGRTEKNKDNVEKENIEAKKMLSGIWIDADEESVIFKAEGDSLFYPDSTSVPVKFIIRDDTLFLIGGRTSKYGIVRQTPNVFEFNNNNGETVRLVRSENANDSLLFIRSSNISVNQNKVIKSDTIVSNDNKSYHCYVQINPTTYKIYRTSFNDEGIEIENVYYDNTVHISVFSGAAKLFSKDFRKADFVKYVPKDVLEQCVLSDVKFESIGAAGFKYAAILAIPDTPSCFIVDITLSFDMKLSMKVS
ncbi:MAG: DUF4738 domain-containing protein [Prevotella sp.]